MWLGRRGPCLLCRLGQRRLPAFPVSFRGRTRGSSVGLLLRRRCPLCCLRLIPRGSHLAPGPGLDPVDSTSSSQWRNFNGADSLCPRASRSPLKLLSVLFLLVLFTVPRPTVASLLVIERGADSAVGQVAVTAFLVKGEPRSQETLVPLGAVQLERGQMTGTLDSPVPLGSGARVIAFGQGLMAEKVCAGEAEGHCILRTFQAGTLAVNFKTKKGTELTVPDCLVARSWTRDSGSLGQEHLVACVRQDDEATRWDCTVPAGRLDLRIDLDGLASSFVWGAEISQSRRTIREVNLLPGVRVEVGADARQASGRLEPLGVSKSLSQARLDFATKHAESSAGELLEFAGAAPGTYRLVVESPGRATFEQSIRIERGMREVQLGTIHLQEEGELSIHVTPPLDAMGEPWRIVAAPLDGGSSAPREQLLDLYGWGAMDDFRPGRYLVVVRDSSSSIWYSEKQEIQSGDSLVLSIPRVEIEGEISVGSNPLMTTLVFGTTQGVEQIKVESDEDGDFHGFLPHEGEWEVELGDPKLGCGQCGGSLGVVAIAPVEVEEGPSGKALLTIELPDTQLRGRVVRDDGQASQPVPGAQVLIIRPPEDGRAGGRQGQLWADDDGAFEMKGFEAGALKLGAIGPSGDGESPWISADVVEGVDPPEVELVLQSRRDLVVTVAGPNGPVAGARVDVFPDGSLSGSEVTDLDGVARLSVPAGSRGPLLVDVPAGEAILSSYALRKGSGGSVSVWAGHSNGSIVLTGLEAVPSPAWLVAQNGMISLDILRNFAPSHVAVSDGRVVIGRLASGHYQVCLWSRSRCRGVDVVPGGQTEVSRSWLMEAE